MDLNTADSKPNELKKAGFLKRRSRKSLIA